MTHGDLGHGWQLTGSSADAYDELLVPAIFEPWAQSLLDLADPRPGDRVLDVACGTGAAAVRMLGCGSVIARRPPGS